MKKVDALELMKGLKIKVYADNCKQIHYTDVFKSLIKRIFKEKQIDFKLSANLNRKMKNQWAKKYKTSDQDKKGNNTVREEQAGLIITKWARKILMNQRNNIKIKKDDHRIKIQIQQRQAQQMALRDVKKNKKGKHDKYNQGKDKQAAAQKNQKNAQQILQE